MAEPRAEPAVATVPDPPGPPHRCVSCGSPRDTLTTTGRRCRYLAARQRGQDGRRRVKMGEVAQKGVFACLVLAALLCVFLVLGLVPPILFVGCQVVFGGAALVLHVLTDEVFASLAPPDEEGGR